MSEKPLFLSNESMREEIRRHKWIESEKKGHDIGFVTAAIDWLKNHGEEWLKYHDPNSRS